MPLVPPVTSAVMPCSVICVSSSVFSRVISVSRPVERHRFLSDFETKDRDAGRVPVDGRR
jgi:hypothetical protein